MDVDTYSRIESKKECYFNYNKKTEKDGGNSINQALHVYNSSKIPTENYSINNDNDGLSKYMAGQLGLQMMWT